MFVSDIIDYLDEVGRFKPFYPEDRDEGRGRPNYHPSMLVKVLVFGYAVGVRSSRKLDRLLERDVAFRFFAANHQPDFRTIADFPKHNREAFTQLFVDIVRLCHAAGMVDFGQVALDGRRVQGDAALAANRTREQIEDEIQDMLDEATAIDADEEEDEEYVPTSTATNSPRNSATSKIAWTDFGRPRRHWTRKNRR